MLPANDASFNDGTGIADDAIKSRHIDWADTGSGDAGGIWWEEIGRTTLSGAADTITVSSLPARKYILIKYTLIATGGTNNSSFIFNSDTGSNYSQVVLDFSAGGAQTTGTSLANLPLEVGSPASGSLLHGVIEGINIATQIKMLYYQNAHSVASAASVPIATIAYGKWANASDPISSITFTNGGTGDFAIGSEVVVLGHD